uniref:OmpA family protein n=1 Tax=Candidatus Cryptobacteroides bacterium TaxID=3085639 RepID=UPI003FF0E766
MKTFRIVMSALAVMAGVLVVSPAADAQENGNRDENGKVVRGAYETNKFGDNWFIGAGAGVNSWLGNGASPKAGVAVDAFVGKWITPTVGVRMGWKGLKDGVSAKDGYTIADEKFNYNSAHVDLLWNLSNLFSGYKETRTWNISVYPTFAYMNAAKNKEFGAGIGMLNNFRLGNRVGLYLDLSALTTKADFAGISPRPKTLVGVLPSATFGLTVNLGKTGFKRHSSVVPAIVPVPFTEAQYNNLQDKVNALEKENKDLKAQIEELKNAKPDTVTVSKAGDLVSPATLYYEIGSTKLSEREEAHLEFYVKNILEQAPDKVFVLTGSADKGTGTAARNQYLSEQRVNNVKKVLVEKYGIAEDHLIVKAEGATNNRFGSAVLNRVVTIE